MNKTIFRTLKIGLLCTFSISTNLYAQDCIQPTTQDKFDVIGCLISGISPVIRNGKIGFVNTLGQTIVSPTYDAITGYDDVAGVDLSDNLIAVKKNGKWGFIDKLGNQKIPFVFDKTFGFHEQRVVVMRNSDKKIGIIDKDGNFILPYTSEYTSIHRYYNQGLLGFEKNGKYGYLDKNAKIAILPKYSTISTFKLNGLASVGSDVNGDNLTDLQGFINKNNQTIIPLKYILAYPASYKFKSSNKIIIQDKSYKYGVVDTNNTNVLPIEFDSIYFTDGFFSVKKNNKYGFYNENGDLVIPLIYDDASKFSENYASVAQMDKYGFIDKNGTVKIPLKYDKADSFEEGLAAVLSNGKWGFINKSGDIAVPVQFDEVGYFSNGLASVKINNKWGFIDKQGRLVIKPVYEKVFEFNEVGLASVELNGKSLKINKDGNVINMPSDKD